MSSPTIILDVDGVLLDYLGGFVPWTVSRGYTPTKRVHEIDDWEIDSWLPGIPHEEARRLIGEFATTEEFGRLPMIPGALEAISNLREAFPHVRIGALTAAGHDPRTAQLRRANLEKFQLDFLTVLPIGASKKDHLIDIGANGVFIDDLMHHIRTAEEVGLATILFRRSYNAHETHHRIANDWSEAAAMIERILGEEMPRSFAA